MGTWRRRGRGFVFVEMLVVTAVIALLLALGYSVYRGARLSARVALASNNIKQIGAALELYFAKYGTYPPFGSDLEVVLAPFVKNPDVFNNPLEPGVAPTQTLSSLYFPPTVNEGDTGKYYITAFVSNDGSTAVVLKTGLTVESLTGLSLNPTSVTDIIHKLTGETVISGVVNIDPRNNPYSEFNLCTPSGQVITRSDLHASRGQASYVGPVDWIRFDPKGTGNQNGIDVDGAFYPLYNGARYEISRLPEGRARIRVWNEVPVTTDTKKKVKTSVDMGEWFVYVMAIGGKITQLK